MCRGVGSIRARRSVRVGGDRGASGMVVAVGSAAGRDTARWRPRCRTALTATQPPSQRTITCIGGSVSHQPLMPRSPQDCGTQQAEETGQT